MSTEPQPPVSGERARRLGTFFGTFMLLVQGLVLYRFVREVQREVDATPWVEAPLMWSRMAWLKAPLWQPPWFEVYALCLAAVAASVLAMVWLVGVRGAWRAWRQDRGRR